jgi:hypothetical protein
MEQPREVRTGCLVMDFTSGERVISGWSELRHEGIEPPRQEHNADCPPTPGMA